MIPTVTVTLVDGVRVVVPDSLESITSYVLREQHDWFEDEIRFLRRVLQPGENVIDIGANYGVYTLSMAKAIGPSGHVWAFEPATSTAARLTQSIAANGFTNVSLERSAVSSATGTAMLSLNQNSELNALIRAPTSTEASEPVPVVTLDSCFAAHQWKDLAFVKLDAEGEEANILLGGRGFLNALSPLIQYEVRAGESFHLELVGAFAALGYDSYRLVPGLGLLAPFDASCAPDAYLLNLFCCKPDRADRLASRGLLVRTIDLAHETAPGSISSIERGKDARFDWRETLAKLPYGAKLVPTWDRTAVAGKFGEVAKALELYARSRDRALPAPERLEALQSSFEKLEILCLGEHPAVRLSTLARVARDLGERLVAVQALQQLIGHLSETGQIDPSEPFLAPGERFDLEPTRDALENWILAAAVEEFERMHSFSSFYTGGPARERLEAIRGLGHGGAEMHRRLDLVQRRFGAPLGLKAMQR